MPGEATKLGPFTGGLHNSSGSGEFIQDSELFSLVNLEVDTDGSLVNRPEIKNFAVSGFPSSGCSFIGAYTPNDGRKFVVVYAPVDDKVYLVDAVTGAAASVSTPAGVTSVACTQYANRLWVVSKSGATADGGFFDAPTSSTISWTTVSAMPRGEAITQYRERLWIACGLSASANTSRFFFSGVGAATNTWGGTDFIDVAPGNGQKLVSLSRLGSDLLLFKEHSTHRFTYTTDPRKAELNEIDATIGVPAVNCVVVYNNNTVYVLHDNAVYELFQMTYSRISTLVNMEQESDLDLFAKDQYGLTIHRDRLFIRYFKNLYVYSLRVKKWSLWESDRKFSKIVVIPSATVGLDTAYASSASQTFPTATYFFQDSRKTSDSGSSELKNPTVGVSTVGGTGTAATTYTLAKPSGVATDWVYIAHQQDWTANEAAPNPPPGFVQVVSRKQVGAQAAGYEWLVWRKKWLASDPSNYTVTMVSAHKAVGIAFTVVGAPEAFPVAGSVMTPAPNGPPTQATITAPSGSQPANSLTISLFLNQDAGTPLGTQTVVGGGYLSRTANLGNLQAFVGYAVNGVTGSVGNIGWQFSVANTGRTSGINFTIPSATQSTTPEIERFQARIESKTYDFDVPHAYKVLFWWGASIATSGTVRGWMIIPNSTRNKTWRQLREQYGTWPAAQTAGQAWASNSDVSVGSEILSTLGRYTRKYLKFPKKVRFRQAKFRLIMDVVTNNGIADASLRLYDLTVFIKQKQGVVKEVS